MIALFGVVTGMVGLAFASVPLYDLFCRVTGFGGTTGVAQAPDAAVGERVITVRFDAGVNSALPWRFTPAQEPMTVRVGETALAFYRARSVADMATAGNTTAARMQHLTRYMIPSRVAVRGCESYGKWGEAGRRTANYSRCARYTGADFNRERTGAKRP